jgi:hypothetical protein
MSDIHRSKGALAILVIAPVLASCSGDKATGPRVELPAIGCSTPTAVSLNALQGVVVSFPASCARLENGGRYLAVPQFAVQVSTPSQLSFNIISAAGVAPTAALQPATAATANGSSTIASRFDARLRFLESDLALQSTPVARQLALSRMAAAASGSVLADSIREFNVLANLDGNTLVKTTARLKYSGSKVYIYEDTGVEYHYTDEEFVAFGRLFDDVLYPIDESAFGPPSDIDGNGHIIVLMSQRINELTEAADCPTQGYVAGYFYGLDLLPDRAGSNRGEVFYTIAPDSIGGGQGKFSCQHTKAQVNRGLPATFIHEFQHMISFNQHVLIRNANSEIAWLNEGLSHIAEELGSKYYEEKYPSPLGRSNPSQLFPDSAQGFGPPLFVNAYNYLTNSTKHSVTSFIGLGTLEERGAAWLFLRWLADQKGEAVFRSLVQTNRRGIDNVSVVAGEPFPALFGDFGIATYTDSIDGTSRSAVPTRYRFTSRNTRQIFARLFPLRPNPVSPTALGCATSAGATMVQGTQAYFIVGGSAGCPAATRLEFAPTGSAVGANGPQLSLFRLP